MIDVSILQVDDALQEEARAIFAKLMRHWCIPRAKNPECKHDYDFIDVNQRYFETLAFLVGFNLVVHKAAGMEVAYLETGDPLNRWKMNKAKSIVFLRLLQYFLETNGKLSLNSGECNIPAEDLLNKVNAFSSTPLGIEALGNILFLFDEFNLVQVCVKRKKDFSESTVIQILPSVTRVLPLYKLENVAELLESYRAESTRSLLADEQYSTEDKDV